MLLQQINEAAESDARHLFLQCCTSDRWVQRMVDHRPYPSVNALTEAADAHWQDLNEDDYLQAFEGHPKIGDVQSLKEKYANTKALAVGEQSSVAQADESIITALAAGNTAYEEKFGFIFIVCATGKSAAEMLHLLNDRLPNTRSEELTIAAHEQNKIFQLRLEKLL